MIVDPSVVGGVVARVDDLRRSVRSRLLEARAADRDDHKERVNPMAVDELNFDPKDIAEALRKNVESFTPSVEREEVGRVVEAGDGIARVKGLPGAMANELLEFPGGVLGLAFNLDEDEIGCIVLGESSQIEEGDVVKQTGRILSIPVGDGFLGRVIDPSAFPWTEGSDPGRRTRGCSRSRPPTSSTANR